MISPSVPIGNSTVPLNFSTAQNSRTVSAYKRWTSGRFFRLRCVETYRAGRISAIEAFSLLMFDKASLEMHGFSSTATLPARDLRTSSFSMMVCLRMWRKLDQKAAHFVALSWFYLWYSSGCDEKKVRQRQWDLFWESSKCRAWRTQGRIRVNSKVHKDQQIFYSISWWIQT